jgi:hypothetical protein
MPMSAADLAPSQTWTAVAERRLSPLQRLCGWNLDADGKVARLLLFHRLAKAAELTGRFRRANFFWQEAHGQLQRLSAQSTPCLASLVKEVFLNTHLAFCRELTEERASLHLDYIWQLIDRTALAQESKHELLAPATLRQISARQEAKQWRRAEKLAAELVAHFPTVDEYQDQLGAMLFNQTVSSLSDGDSQAKSLRDAETLQKGIDTLMRLRDDYPHNLTLMERLGHLHHLRAIKLTNGRRLAEALAEVQMALTFHPDLEAAQKTQQRLEQMMQDLRVQMATAAAERHAHPKKAYRRTDKRLKEEASKGFRLMDDFKRSAEAHLISEDLLAARGRRMWREIGLGPLEPLDLRPLVLYHSVQSILRDPPPMLEEVSRLWNQVAMANRDLAELDASPVCRYLSARLFGPEQGPAEPSAAQEESPTPVSASRRRLSSEPFLYWLFSGQGKRVKIQCAVAIVLLALAFGLMWREMSHRKSRDTAYSQLQEAREARDYRRIVEGAEAFLSHPVLGRDGREVEVKALYSEALVRWFVGQVPPQDQKDAHLRRYSSLMGDRARGGAQP